MKTVYQIDALGFMTYETLEIGETDETPKGYVDVPLPSNSRGEQLPFWKPKWTGTEWIETRSQSDIEIEKTEPVPPTPIESLSQDVESVAEMVSMVMIDSEITKEDFGALAEAIAMLMVDLDAIRTAMPIPGEV